MTLHTLLEQAKIQAALCEKDLATVKADKGAPAWLKMACEEALNKAREYVTNVEAGKAHHEAMVSQAYAKRVDNRSRID